MHLKPFTSTSHSHDSLILFSFLSPGRQGVLQGVVRQTSYLWLKKTRKKKRCKDTCWRWEALAVCRLEGPQALHLHQLLRLAWRAQLARCVRSRLSGACLGFFQGAVV